MSEEAIRSRCHSFDLSAVFTLSLASLRLRRLDSAIHQCTSLTHLDLSNNNFTRLGELQGGFQKLKILNLSRNAINDLSNVCVMPALEELYLQGNVIISMDQIESLKGKFPSLRCIYFQELNRSLANPVCQQPNYRQTILSLFPSLLILDGQRLKAQYAQSIHQLCEEVKMKFGSHSEENADFESASTPWIQSGEYRMMEASEEVVEAEIEPKMDELKGILKECKRLLQESDQMTAKVEAMTTSSQEDEAKTS